MLRWMVLIGSFAIWAACLALVYVNFKPAPRQDMEAEARAALEQLFSENADERRAWKIYADPVELDEVKTALGVAAPSAQIGGAGKRAEWNGVNEKNLVFAGRLETAIKNRRDTSLEEETKLAFSFPGTPLRGSYAGKAFITMEKGMESCELKLNLKYDTFEIDALSAGNRDGDVLNLNTVITQNGQPLYSGKRKEPVGGKAAPNADLAPFQFNPGVDVGREWNVSMLDFNLALAGKTDSMTPLRVKCTGKRTIMLDGLAMSAFEVRSEKGEARAWYSPNGEVLKQTYKLAGMLEVMVVREDLKRPARELKK